MRMGARMAGRVEEDSGIEAARLATLARGLARAYPTGTWWPFDDPFAIAVSAVLTQQTRWSAVEKAMASLRREQLLTPATMASATRSKLERLLRPTGFYRQKARAVQGIARILCARFGASMERAFELPTGELRAELLSWPGVGEETADSILLYAADRPVFVVDAYTRRLMERFGAVRGRRSPSYGQTADAWARASPGGARAFKAMHGAIVEHGKRVCAKVPRCPSCPLQGACAKRGIPA